MICSTLFGKKLPQRVRNECILKKWRFIFAFDNTASYTLTITNIIFMNCFLYLLYIHILSCGCHTMDARTCSCCVIEKYVL